jgi:hypothetical protein
MWQRPLTSFRKILKKQNSVNAKATSGSQRALQSQRAPPRVQLTSVLAGTMASGASKNPHVRVSVPLIALLFLLSINLLLLVLYRGSFSSWLHPTSNQQKLLGTTVYQLLQAARDKIEAGQGLTHQHPGLHNQSCCTVASQQLHGVLAEAAAFETAARAQGDMLTQERARVAALELRQQLSREWAAVLAPFSQATGPSSGSCRSVRLTPPSAAPSSPPPLSQVRACLKQT